MHSALNIIWACADVREPVFTWDDVQYWPSGQLQFLMNLGVLAESSASSYATCDCPDSPTQPVQMLRYPDGTVRFFIRCSECGRVEIPKERLRRFAVRIDALAGQIGRVIEPGVTPEMVFPERLWRLGRKTVSCRSRGIWLARGLTWSDGPAVAQAIPRAGSPITLLTGSIPDYKADALRPEAMAHAADVITAHGNVLAVDWGAIESRLAGPDHKVPARQAKRGPRASAIEQLIEEMRTHIRSARDHAVSKRDFDEGAKLLSCPSKELLAVRLKLSKAKVTRCFQDSSMLRYLYDLAQDLEKVIAFRG